MHVLFMLATACGVLLGACSDDGGASPIRRRAETGTAAPARTPGDGSQGGSSASPTPAPPAPASDPAPAPDAGPTPPTTPPAPAGSCGNPGCLAAFGVGGCKATNGAGTTVTMGCQDGACACLTGGQTTATFEGDATNAAEASQLFLSNCDCN